MRTLTMLRAWSLWLSVAGAALLLAFSTFDPMIAALALSAVGLFVFHALLRGQAEGGSLPREFLNSFVLSLGVLLIPGANAVEAEVPQNATAGSYGSGWTCDPGYRKSGEECRPVMVPKDAYATRGSYGLGWDCRHGFREDNERCLPVQVPANAYLDASGSEWSCNRGFREADDRCVEIAVPENGYLVGGDYGPGWKCERGFRSAVDSCTPVLVPENGYLSESVSSKRGWECERGFVKSGVSCSVVTVAANAHLRYDGASWECDKPFRKRNGACSSP